MSNDSDIENFHIPDFKLFHLSLYGAARFAAKIRLLEGYLDINHPDEPEFYDLNNPDLDKLLEDQYKILEDALLKAAQSGSLKVTHLERDIHDQIDITATYVEIHDLADWLDKRGTSIYGDFFEKYQEEQFDYYWIAEQAIKAELIREKNKTHKNGLSDEALIVYLQEQNEALKNERKKDDPKQEKPLHTKEKESLLKILLGLALTNYTFDPHASRNSTSREITDDLRLHGLSVDEDTVRKWLSEAKEYLPDDWNKES